MQTSTESSTFVLSREITTYFFHKYIFQAVTCVENLERDLGPGHVTSRRSRFAINVDLKVSNDPKRREIFVIR